MMNEKSIGSIDEQFPFVDVLLPHVKTFAYVWFNLQAAKRRYHKKHDKRMPLGELLKLKNEFLQESEENKVRWASRLLAKLRRDIDAGHRESFVEAILQKNSQRRLENCVLSIPDQKGKIRRIDCLRQADKVWRLDIVMVVIFRGIPLESTDGERIEKAPDCIHQHICINPYHVNIAVREIDTFLSAFMFDFEVPVPLLLHNAPQAQVVQVKELIYSAGIFGTEELVNLSKCHLASNPHGAGIGAHLKVDTNQPVESSSTLSFMSNRSAPFDMSPIGQGVSQSSNKRRAENDVSGGPDTKRATIDSGDGRAQLRATLSQPRSDEVPASSSSSTTQFYTGAARCSAFAPLHGAARGPRHDSFSSAATYGSIEGASRHLSGTNSYAYSHTGALYFNHPSSTPMHHGDPTQESLLTDPRGHRMRYKSEPANMQRSQWGTGTSTPLDSDDNVPSLMMQLPRPKDEPIDRRSSFTKPDDQLAHQTSATTLLRQQTSSSSVGGPTLLMQRSSINDSQSGLPSAGITRDESHQNLASLADLACEQLSRSNSVLSDGPTATRQQPGFGQDSITTANAVMTSALRKPYEARQTSYQQQQQLCQHLGLLRSGQSSGAHTPSTTSGGATLRQQTMASPFPLLNNFAASPSFSGCLSPQTFSLLVSPAQTPKETPRTTPVPDQMKTESTKQKP